MAVEMLHQPNILETPEKELPQASYALITRYIKGTLHILVSKSSLSLKYGLPGGKYTDDDNDDLEATLIREVREETGLIVHKDQIDHTPLSRTRADDGFGHEQMSNFYLVNGVDGDPQPSKEMIDPIWINLADFTKQKDLDPSVHLLFMHARDHLQKFGRRPIASLPTFYNLAA